MSMTEFEELLLLINSETGKNKLIWYIVTLLKVEAENHKVLKRIEAKISAP